MQKEKEQQDKLKAVKARLLYGDESGRNPRNHKESHYSESKTPTSRTEPRRRHGSPGRGRRVVYSIGWEEKNEAHLHILTVATKIPKQREPRCNQGSIIIRAHHPKEPADIRRVKTAKEIWHFDFPRTRMPGHVKTYDRSRDLEVHLKLFQSTTKIERWAMPTWCHMFNSMITGNGRVWFDKLPKESIDSYEDLKTAFRENYLQQIKHIKDPMEIHHIKQRDGESTEDFIERYKAEVLDVKAALECMKISGFMHGITHPKLIKYLYKKIPRSMDEIGLDRKPDRFSLLTKTPKEIFALEKGKFKAPPPMHGRMHAAEKTNRGDGQVRKIVTIHQRIKTERQAKGTKEGGNNQKGQAPSHPDGSIIGEGAKDGTEGPMIIEAEMGGHFVHRMYVDKGASSEVLYEHCFVRLRPEIRSQMIPATTPLIGFSGETIWPLGQISLLVKIGDDEHSSSVWMNFMVIRSPS
ncbi:reverse transcriptase domain-containing protein [Tanacetum coccineum]|uniref:Reverse transcriptase domain-containing protein n=1 Tax=Tanacetum coccineum TaxID=301880 RepID=A0ABQ5CGA5_9ASTR